MLASIITGLPRAAPRRVAQRREIRAATATSRADSYGPGLHVSPRALASERDG